MERKTASQFDQELLDLYDDYAHSRIGRRDFLERAGKFAAGGLTAAALLEILSPNYAWATQIPKRRPAPSRPRPRSMIRPRAQAK